MPKPFKDEINPAGIGALAAAVTRVHPGFAAADFEAAAADGLEALELKQRVAHVAACLARCLPGRSRRRRRSCAGRSPGRTWTCGAPGRPPSTSPATASTTRTTPCGPWRR
ncbi:hypothetical protein [Streptomyces sudanensis]|uniref:hypothetical protein n=1 Tax=Streptomyces sudanensis TaxID=436397 RepID=UPI0020CEB083|nr:hypothetical protein [Streptomyces sudanensis]MCP9956406.1 hypothetical protein [Streptomyces sudanensis]